MEAVLILSWPHTGKSLAGNRCYRVSMAKEVVIPAGHQMVIPGKIPAGIFPGGSWMVDSLNKPPGGKCVMVFKSLLEGGRRRVSVETFNPSDEDDLLQKNTHLVLVHPVEAEENPNNQSWQKYEVSCSVRKVTAKEPLLEALRKLSAETQYDLTKEEKRQLSGILKTTSWKHSMVNYLGGLI